jgi:WD40 repeat protein
LKKDEQLVATLYGHKQNIVGFLELANGDLLSAAKDGIARRWNMKTGELIKEINTHTEEIVSLALLTNGNLAVASEDCVNILDLNTDRVVRSFRDEKDSYPDVLALSNNRVACIEVTGKVHIWNIETDEHLATPLKTASCLLELPNKQLVICREPGRITLHNATTYELIETLHGHKAVVWSLLLLSESEMASSSQDKTIKIWNFETGQRLRSLTGHVGECIHLSLLKNDMLVSAAFEDDNKIHLWKWKSGQLVKTIREDHEIRTFLALKESDYLATASSSYQNKKRSQAINIWKAV